MRGAHSEARVWTRGDLGREMLPHQPKPFLYKRVKIFLYDECPLRPSPTWPRPPLTLSPTPNCIARRDTRDCIARRDLHCVPVTRVPVKP